MNALDTELALDRFEAELAPELAAHAREHHARALVAADAQAPPWPQVLLDGRVARLVRSAAELADADLRGRIHTLNRWAHAAALAADSAWQDACTRPRDLAGLAVRHRALSIVAKRRANASARTLIDTIYSPVTWFDHRPTTSVPALPTFPPDDLPTWQAVLARLAQQHDLDTVGLDVQPGAKSLTIVIAPGRVRCVLGPGSDALDALIVATHELGHGLYAAQQAGLSLGLAAAPSRWFDEAVAAWAVRSLEDDPMLADAARARRHHRERLTARLAGFEAALFDGEHVADAWYRWIPDVDPNTVPALFDEPGVMASYHAADCMQLHPDAGELRRWARTGARR